MARAPDEEMPADEPLYRSISAADVIGIDVLSSAVDLPRCSFNRGKYSAAQDVLVARRPDDNGIVAITGNELPAPVPRASGAPYEFFTADDPNLLRGLRGKPFARITRSTRKSARKRWNRWPGAFASLGCWSSSCSRGVPLRDSLKWEPRMVEWVGMNWGGRCPSASGRCIRVVVVLS